MEFSWRMIGLYFCFHSHWVWAVKPDICWCLIQWNLTSKTMNRIRLYLFSSLLKVFLIPIANLFSLKADKERLIKALLETSTLHPKELSTLYKGDNWHLSKTSLNTAFTFICYIPDNATCSLISIDGLNCAA